MLLETETDTERRENVLAARFRDTERESAGVGLIVKGDKTGSKYFFKIYLSLYLILI